MAKGTLIPAPLKAWWDCPEATDKIRRLMVNLASDGTDATRQELASEVAATPGMRDTLICGLSLADRMRMDINQVQVADNE